MFDASDPVVWTDYADRSYLASRVLWFSSLLLDAPVQAHRTTELYLKAFLVSGGVPVRKGGAWGHNLGELYDLSVRMSPEFKSAETERRVRFLDRYFHFVRYPSGSAFPEDGSGIWFAFDANILVLDEIVAYTRPRIRLEPADWQRSQLHHISSKEDTLACRALKESNEQLPIINCSVTSETYVSFKSSFGYDKPGC